MAHTKSAGSTQNNRDSQPKFLGVKRYAGEIVKPGVIIIRQRGTRVIAGDNVRMGRDHTLYSVADGKVLFTQKRKRNFNGTTTVRKVVSVI